MDARDGFTLFVRNVDPMFCPGGFCDVLLLRRTDQNGKGPALVYLDSLQGRCLLASTRRAFLSLADVSPRKSTVQGNRVPIHGG